MRRRKHRLYNRDYYLRNKPEKLENSRAYNKSQKGKASQALRDAVRWGKIKRQPCEVCGVLKSQGHHEDYSKPLDVVWLCAKHHAEVHTLLPWQIQMRRAGYKGTFLLGQLIDGCGDSFLRLVRHESYPEATTLGAEEGRIEIIWEAVRNPEVEGWYRGTPEAAVAALYLSTHGKENV